MEEDVVVERRKVYNELICLHYKPCRTIEDEERMVFLEKKYKRMLFSIVTGKEKETEEADKALVLHELLTEV